MAISALTKFLINPQLRWMIYFTILFLTMLAYIQEPLRFSTAKGITGLSYMWETYIFGMINLINYFVSFFALWLTIPFVFNFPKYWFIALFFFLFAVYTEIFFNSREITNKNENDFNPPPWYMYPKKQRLIIHYFIFAFDVMIFLQFFLSSNDLPPNVKTILDKYILGRFGGWIEGNRINFVVSWLGSVGLLYDVYNIHNQSIFNACMFELPKSWNF